jgi:hypothetical protein
LALSVAVPLFAQSYTATLEGLVTDQSGAVIPGAKVIVTNEATNLGRNTVTDALGHYFFTLLPPGSYRLEASSTGFKGFVRTGMVLEVQQAVRVDVQLVPGAITTKVEVKDVAPRLDNVNATEGRVVDSHSMLDLPVSAQSRNPTAFAQLTPGIVNPGGYESGGGVNFSANGGRLDLTDIVLDGVSTSVQEHNSGIQGFQYNPTVESVQEFKVQTNSFGAEYGNSAGALITMVTRSGTNQLHGDVFEFHQENAFDANSFFSNENGGSVGHYVYNRFGGVVGGPVYIPKVWDGRNKTFFFFAYEQEKIPGSTTKEYDTVPTAAERQGDFSKSFNGDGTPVELFDPNTAQQNANGTWVRSPIPGNIINPSNWSSVAKSVIPFYPSPTSTGTGPAHIDNFYGQGTATSSWNERSIKIDHNFTVNQRLSARYSRDFSNSVSPNLWGSCPSSAASLPYCGNGAGNFMAPMNNGFSSNKSQNAVVDYTNTLSPTTILNFRAGVSRLNAPSGINGELGYFNEHDLGFKDSVSMQVQRAPSFFFQGYPNGDDTNNSSMGPNVWAGNINAADIIHAMGSVTKVKGKNTFKMGAEARFSRLNYAQPQYNTASFVFCNAETGQQPLNPVADQGNGLASFMLGWGSSSGCGYTAGQSFNPVSLAAARTYSAYIQDDFHATSKLTVNIGLRYEVPMPATERHNRNNWIDLQVASPVQSGVSSFMTATSLAGAGLPAGDPTSWATACPGCSNLTGGYIYTDSSMRTTYNTDITNWAPRIGFDYQFRPNMVVRGGYGIYYGLNNAQQIGWLGDGYSASTNFIPSKDGGVTQYASIDNPFPAGIVPMTGSSLGLLQSIGSEPNAAERNLSPSPRIQQYSLSIERELRGNSKVEIAYSGSKGNSLGYGTMRGWASFFPVSDLSLGSHLFDQYPNPFNGVVPATADESGPTISLWELLQNHPEFYYISGKPGPPWGNSLYHSAYIEFTRRMSNGLQATVSYTYSKLIDDSESPDDPNVDWLVGGINANGGNRPRTQDWGNLKASDRSVSIMDTPNRFVADFIYQLPIGHGHSFGGQWSKTLDMLAGGWQFNGLATISSGPPLIPHLANKSFLETGVYQRPNMVAGQTVVEPGSVVSKLNKYLNPAAFSQPAAYTFGTAPRTLSYARGPGFHGADLSLFKQFYLNHEKERYFELRLEALNAFNTPIFSVPDTTYGDGSFGQITGQVNGNRVVQLGGKFYF